MFKMARGVWINPAHVTSITFKEIPKGKKTSYHCFFAITLIGNTYKPSPHFESVEKAKEWLGKLMEAIEDEKSA